jgi:hypothetical protein
LAGFFFIWCFWFGVEEKVAANGLTARGLLLFLGRGFFRGLLGGFLFHVGFLVGGWGRGARGARRGWLLKINYLKFQRVSDFENPGKKNAAPSPWWPQKFRAEQIEPGDWCYERALTKHCQAILSRGFFAGDALDKS